MTLDRPTRRRGEELENALLDAAWDELVENGYAGLTYEAVATRAHTSRAVLYRRWPDRESLVRALVRRSGERVQVQAPDTGSLRGDVIELLRESNRHRFPLWIVLAVQLAPFYAETGVTPAELRQELIGDRASSMEAVVARARARGELRDGLSERALGAAFAMFRSEAIMRLGQVPDEVIVEIVDEVYLPLVGT